MNSVEKSQIRFWRRGFVGLIFLLSILMTTIQPSMLETHFPDSLLYIFCALAVILSPFMVLLDVALQIVNPLSDSHWELPTADSNPLSLRNPLPFNHFAAQLGIAMGAGMLLASIWCGWQVFVLGLTGLLVGLGWFLGLRWSIRLAGDKVR